MKLRVTPEMAREWLGRSEQNYRKLDNERVRMYALDMRSGNWDYNGETIKLNCNGSVIDGQHRLHAIVESGCSITTEVIEGVDKVQSIDRGKPRTTASILAAMGEKNVNLLAASVVLYGRLLRNRFDVGRTMSSAEVIKLLHHNGGIRESLKVVSAHSSVHRFISVTPATVLHYTVHQIDKELADDFFSKFLRKDADKSLVDITEPASGLREFYKWNRMRAPNLRVHTVGLLASSIKAWNYYFMDKKLTSNPNICLLWRGTGPKSKRSVFPAIAGFDIPGYVLGEKSKKIKGRTAKGSIPNGGESGDEEVVDYGVEGSIPEPTKK